MKSELRKASLEKRKTLDCAALSLKIMNNLMRLGEYKAAKNLICYYPLKYEIDTSLCLNDKTKNIYLPRVKGDMLEICTAEKLEKGSFGILEPQCEGLKDYSKIDMILVPACAADKNGFRLGYGRGFYDRFLPLLTENSCKVILIYSELLYETVYPDKYDVNCSIIVTDKEILRIS